ncbi:PAS domain S-box protein [Schlegelella sp. S2-27]|uniref:PAS domain S-box protein n=1 Tax=Caldimonas mangrovi TaxID=2944811 RepID=A0ABT0YT84_9BURK|nr:PAS domain S-box protein [Caldimonas mangrovi]MCM5681940.1 PAS domain S-box protein [Caldimonas mangrovi]
MASIDYEKLVQAIGDAVVVVDVSGVIVTWNAAATRIFGYTEAEALGRSLDLIIPERQRDRHWEGYMKTVSSGTTRYGSSVLRVPALHRDGAALSIAFTVALLYKDSGQVDAIAAVIRDETTRFAEERALRKRLTELETKLAVGASTP